MGVFQEANGHAETMANGKPMDGAGDGIMAAEERVSGQQSNLSSSLKKSWWVYRAKRGKPVGEGSSLCLLESNHLFIHSSHY